MKSLLKKLSIVVAAVFLLSACAKKDKAAPPTKSFSVAKFKANLQQEIKNSAATMPRGYSFVINQNGKWADTSSYGVASMSRAGSFTAMHPDQEINIASVTKAMTSVAVQQLLKKNNLKLTDQIGQWLPIYFYAAKEVRELTFVELLTHTSGISESSCDFESMKALVKKGLDDPAKKKKYANLNFGLFRAMIPFLRDKSSAQSQEASMVPQNIAGFENWLNSQYIGYMQQHLFSAIGMPITNCKPSDNTAQAFNEGENIETYTPGDWTSSSGGGGYFMSTMEMARFIAYLAHDETLLSKMQREEMDSKFLGWDTWHSQMTVAGQSYGKDGALQWGAPGLQTLIVKYPNGVELALTINSYMGNFRDMSTMAKDAYNAAWTMDK
ncbi:MAG: serine hydrolase [Chitinophagaceae bacterium]|nr:serine hydrolase [Chitinophagaceae bacterium]